MATTRRIWNALQPSLTQQEQAAIVHTVETEGVDFDVVILELVRRGLMNAKYCPHCGQPLLVGTK
jgi:hypothetical protein